MALIAHPAVPAALRKAQGGPRRAVVQQHQPCPAVGHRHNRRIAGQQNLQFLPRQFRRGRHKAAALPEQERRCLAVHHRNTGAGAVRNRPVRSQLSHRSEHHAAEQIPVFLRPLPQRLQRILLAHIRQRQPVSRPQLRLQCPQGFQPVILRPPDHPQARVPGGFRLFRGPDVRHRRHPAFRQAHRGQGSVLPVIRGKGGDPFFRQRAERFPADGVHQGNRHKRAVCFRFSLIGDKDRIPGLFQASFQFLFRCRPGLRRGHRLPGHGDGVFPVRRCQGQRLTRHSPQPQADRHRPSLHRFRRRQLRRGCQAVYHVPGFHLRIRAHPQDGRFPGPCLRARVDQVRFRMVPADRQPVIIPQVLFQFHPRQFSVRGSNLSDPDPLMVHPAGKNHAGILAAQRVSLHKAAPVENLEQPFLLCFIRFPEAARLQAVQPLPVAVRDHGHIFRPLQPAFQLDRGNPRRPQFRQFIPQAHIPGTEPRAPAAAVIILHAAGLGAPAAVSAPFTDHAGKQAQPAYRHTLRAVGKHLGLHACIRAFPDFGQAAFPGQHCPADALFSAPEDPRPVMDGHLGAGVHRQAGKEVPDDPQDTQVLHQHRVRLQVPQQA